MEILGLISTILTLLFGSGLIITYILFRKQSIALKNLEVAQTKVNVEDGKYALYEKRLETLNNLMENHNETFTRLSNTIDDLTQRLISKTDQIRKITDDLIKSEEQMNELNVKLNDAIEEIGKLRMQVQKLHLWKCIRNDCADRQPDDNIPILTTLTYRDE